MTTASRSGVPPQASPTRRAQTVPVSLPFGSTASAAPTASTSVPSGSAASKSAASGSAASGPPMSSAPVYGSSADAPSVPAHMLPHRTPAQLLAIARQGLVESAQTRPDGLRYAAAHLAALRAAAAVLAARARPAAPSPRRSNRVTSVWSLLLLVAPELGEWATFFAHGAHKRAAAEAGIPRVVSARDADDLLRAAAAFVAVVETTLGLPHQPTLDEGPASGGPPDLSHDGHLAA